MPYAVYPDRDGQDLHVNGSNYDDGDDYDPAEVTLYSEAPVSPGHEYGIESDGYACIEDGEGEDDDDCALNYIGLVYASVNVTIPRPQVTSLSTYSVNQGDQGTLTVIGTNLVQGASDQLTANLTTTGNVSINCTPFTPSGLPSSGLATFAYNFTGCQTGTWNFTVSNNEGKSSGNDFTVNPQSPPPPPPPPLDPCAVTSNPQAGYSSIVSTGAVSGSGSISVSFSGAAFSSLNPSVTYGPYSSPSSIASSLAAIVTKKYLQYGLSAKAFGPIVIYNGLGSLGTVSNVVTGGSISTNNSSTAATEAKDACESAPPPPPAGLSCNNVIRGATMTCVARGGSVSNWSFTDGTNTVNRTTNVASPTWSGIMVTSGTVSVNIAGAMKTSSITVSPRSGWAFTAAPATQQVNPYTPPASSPCSSLSVDNPPVVPATGSTETLGLSEACQSDNATDLQLNSGPNSGYSFFTSATNGTLFNWVGAQDVLNPTSVFFGKQCGNYSQNTNVGFISGINLLLNLTRHESSATQGQGH